MAERRVKIMEKWWRLIFTKDLPKDLDGLTDTHTLDGRPRRNKKIQIDKTLRGQVLLETLLHELLHAAIEPLNEDYVETTAHDQAAIFCHPDCLKRFADCPRIRAMLLEALDLTEPVEDPSNG
jgi:hypothetical protein